ncbi:UNVERIFIED_ASMBLY: tail fiber protein [Shigella phage 2019SD1]|uniref:Tail fiber protein n=1 Tax=Shigella phage 2019SD1 TaxID=2848074 RepID=A0A6M5CEH8_9CAUD|nr:tail protein [Shigella phage 2019SD1]
MITGSKGGSSKPYVPKEMEDNLISINKIKILLAVSDGECDPNFTLRDLYLDDVPVIADDGTVNYRGVKAEFRHGTQTQDYIRGLLTHQAKTLARDITTTNPYVISVTNKTLSAIRIKILMPTGIKQEDNGDLVGVKVTYAVDMAVDGDSYKEVLIDTIEGKTRSGYDRSRRIDLPAFNDRVLLRVRRVTADSTSSRVTDLIKLQSYAEVIDAKFRYPLTGLVYVEFDSELFLTRSTLARDITTTNPYVISVTNKTLSAIRIKILMPTGIKQEDNGDLVGVKVTYAVDMAVDGDSYKEVLIDTIEGKTRSGYDRSRRIDLPAFNDRVLLRVRRVTADSTSSRVTDLIKLQSYAEVIDAKFRYPLTGLVYVEFDSELFLTRSREYHGSWDGTFKKAWSNNPAWVLYDIITNQRYGLDQRELGVQVDKWSLYEAAQYCDQKVPDGKGGTEPRYLCDVVIQSQIEAYQLIRDICSIFRGMSFWNGESLSIVIDKPRDPSYIFTNDNVVDGDFQYTTASEKSMYTQCNVTFDDEQNMYQQDVEGVFDTEAALRFGYNPTSITAIGCTRRSEANRRGRWILKPTCAALRDTKTNLRSTTVNFATGLEGMIPSIGDVIAVSDNFYSSNLKLNLSGRVMEVSGLQVFVPFKIDARPVISLSSTSLTESQLSAQSQRVVSWDKVPYASLYEMQWRKGDGNWLNTPQTANKEIEVEGIYSGNYRPNTSLSDAVKLTGAPGSPPYQSAKLSQFLTGRCRTGSGNRSHPYRPNTSLSDAVKLTGAPGSPPYQSAKLSQFLTGRCRTGSGNRSHPYRFGIRVKWGMPEGSGDTAYIELHQSPDGTAENSSLLTLIPYPQYEYWHGTLPAGHVVWYRIRSVDRIGNVSGWTDFVRGMASDDVEAVLGNILDKIFDTEAGKDLKENAIDSANKIKDQAQSIIQNALANDADVRIMRKENGKRKAEFRQSIQLIASETEARVTAMTQLKAEFDEEITSEVTRLDQAIATESETRATAIEELKSQIGDDIQGQLTRVEEAIASETEARVSADTALTAKFGDVESALTEKLDSWAGVNGVGAQYAMKLGLTYNGQKYSAGMVMQLSNSAQGLISQILLMLEDLRSVENNQVFINSLLVKDGSINNAKIGNFIQSNNWDGNNGWHINKNGDAYLMNATVRGSLYASNGNFSFNGTNNTVVINNNGITVNLPNGGRVVVGVW